MLTKAAVFISGGGTNLQALIDAWQAGEMPSCQLALVVASNPDAGGIARARKAGVSVEVVETDRFATPVQEARLLEVLRAYGIDVIALAGYLCILSDAFVAQYPDRILNVHPSLIPSFCGAGYHGLFVHEAALARGVKLTGATVHYVNADIDGGKIILQKAVPVEEGDTPESLQKRVMEQAEWVLLPRAMELVCARVAREKEAGRG